jgi:hypothetical protein
LLPTLVGYSLKIHTSLEPFALTEDQKAHVIPQLLKYAGFIDTDGNEKVSGQLGDDSEFFAFERKMRRTVSALRARGLGIR